MRLIDADELKKVLCEEYEAREHYIGEIMLKAIDNAPTEHGVETRPTVNCKDCDGYEAGYSAGLKDAERPQGEWIEKEETPASVSYYCSVCKTEGIPITPFCPWCGAKMKGGKE